MIAEYLCYKIRCEKCGHSWVTKTHEIPVRCAKCNSVKWNEGWPPMMPKIIETTQPITDEPKDALAAFIAKAQAEKGIVAEIVEDVIEVAEQWNWTKDAPQFADDGNVYRRQWLAVDGKPKFRTVRVDPDDHESIA